MRRAKGGGSWVLLAILIAFMPCVRAAQSSVIAPEATPAPQSAQGPPTLMRSLRDNVPFEMPEPTEPKVFKGYSAVPAFSVVPRKDHLMFFPCTACHSLLKPNPEPRKLSLAPHPAALLHGNGRFWCLTCHQLTDRDHLHTLSGEPVDFDDSYLVCGQCHYNRQKDWYFGAHGKRVANWQGERVIYNCTFCHDPHDPTLKPRAPNKPPPVRAGLASTAADARAAPPGTGVKQ